MFGVVRRMFSTTDLRRKLLFSVFIIVIFRLGSFIPSPYVNFTNVQVCLAANSGATGIYELINLFSGGALLQLSVFALGVMPYITSSIIIQLLRVVVPRFEQLYKQGQEGQAKLIQYTRYLTIGLAVLQSTTLITVARSGALFAASNSPACSSLLTDDSWYSTIIIVIVMTAGTGLIMWLGELITERGIGNGMSILIFTSIAAGFPGVLVGVYQTRGFGMFSTVVITSLVVMVGVVFVEQSQRRVPVQYAKRVVGRRILGGGSTYLPIKLNMAGVVPVIFASAILRVPSIIAQFSQPAPGQPPAAWVVWINENFTTGNSPFYIALYFFMIVGFTYFYVAVTFNPTEIADNMKNYGGFISGIRPGVPTANYLSYIIKRITLPGSLYLGIVSLIPLIAFALFGLSADIPLGGTSVLIMVGVGLDTVKQIDAQMQQRHYRGLLTA
ncbi:preprotein translocase subunit SecY [Tropheryma whipplei]|uniref:Protein translocase subunit SecY n=1 Tax=Tropheryma whipplei (strain Twist) TaxID=203267 RepID=Q83MT8_TROWT|nr:preprotein translocase subunit SecY [Tropheryma whipplei]AAO44632.1 preprotein translocase SecY subunit [Tropheryma whipplei str. Twist]MCO8182562.1 preprotein translocase subunit SecY [Tropheryma whipplei]MCO8189970.1 preprotein translocase subunit SecY [Tropheryma whipplei]CAD66902.1 preprotein translocase SecY subunit [Tropheryma whipplei TW08/27]